MNKGELSILLRKLGLMKFTDDLRYRMQKNEKRRKNKEFKRKYPDIKLPPDYLIYESFQIDYDEYYTKSINSAKWILDHVKKFHTINNVSILDWGCGPGRIIRHMPAFLDDNSKLFGTDYNSKSIDWCKTNIDGIDFNCNSLEAKLPYKDDSFDIIYGISIFTHLSEKKHYDWITELTRVLKHGGVMFLTAHGDSFIDKLTEIEKSEYQKGNIVERGMTIEGHRTYTAYHPAGFMNKLFEKLKILEHIEIPTSGSKAQQDIWIVGK